MAANTPCADCPSWNPSRSKWARPSTNQWEVEATILGMSSSDITGCRVPARSRIYGRLPSFKGRRASSKVPAFTSARKDDCSSTSYTSCTETTTLEMSLTRVSKIKGERNCRAGPPWIILYACRLIRQEPMVLKSTKQLWTVQVIQNQRKQFSHRSRVCILETQSLWSRERSVKSSEDLKDWKEVSIGDPERFWRWQSKRTGNKWG